MRRIPIDDILPEYDFGHASRNKYASRYRPGSRVVVLDPDVSAVFRNSKEVNEALRALAKAIQKHCGTLDISSRRPKRRTVH